MKSPVYIDIIIYVLSYMYGKSYATYNILLFIYDLFKCFSLEFAQPNT